jgi:hypothetical protein
MLLVPFASAICAVCTAAVGSFAGLSRWFGVDDTITGMWLGGLILSSALWLISWLDKKNIKFRFRKILILSLCYVSVILPLYSTNLIGNPYNTIFGIDKLIAGIIVGSIVFPIGTLTHFSLKKRNGNKVYFPFQGVIIPILFLVLASVMFYFMIVW